MLVAKPDPLNVSESLHQELSIQLYTIPQLQTTLLSPILFFVSCKGKSARFTMCITLHTWQFCSGFHWGPLHILRAPGLLPIQHICYKISFVFAYATEIGGKEIYDVVTCSISVLLLNSQVSFLRPKAQFHVVIKNQHFLLFWIHPDALQQKYFLHNFSLLWKNMNVKKEKFVFISSERHAPFEIEARI